MPEQTIKYIRFRLPGGAGGMAAGMTGASVSNRIKEWAESAGVEYRSHREGHKLDVCFASQEDYTMFLLSWNPPYQHSWYIPELGYDESSCLYTK